MTLIRNQMAQPLELHFQSRTIVIPPYGESVIEPEEEGVAAVAAFDPERLLFLYGSDGDRHGGSRGWPGSEK